MPLFLLNAFAHSPDRDFQLVPHPEKLAKAKALEAKALAGKDSAMLAEAYYQYGNAHIHGGLFESGEVYFLKSLRILEPRGDSYELGRLYIKLSTTEIRLKRYRDAITKGNKAVAVFERVASRKGLFDAYIQLGYLHRKAGDGSLSMDYLRKAESLSIEANDSLGLASVSMHIGTDLIKQKKSEGFRYLDKSKELYEKLGKAESLVTALTNIAMGHMDMGNVKAAGIAVAEAQERYDQIIAPDIMVTIVVEDAVQRYLNRTGKWEEAYRRLAKRRLLDVKHIGIQQDSVIRRLHAEFETEKKETLLAAQQNEIKMQRNQNYFLLSVLCLLVAFIAILYRLYRRNWKLSRQNASLVREQGHRIRNHLQMISNMLQLNSGVLSDPEAKATLVESELRVQSIAMLQKGLYSRDSGAGVFLPEYFALLTDHVLEVSGYGWVEKRLDIEAIFLDPDRALPVALILNELVTNACKYAFPGHPSPQLSLKCRQEEGRIHFGVADNGPGFEPSLPGSEQSFGMQLIRIQAEQLYAVYSFQNDPETGGARFEMEFSV